MISPGHAQLMSRYNRWQNASLYTVADLLPDADRRRDVGAFFGSIHATLNHLLWGDQTWLHRFAGTPAPEAKSPRASVESLPPWDLLKDRRQAFDANIIDWAGKLDPAWLAGELTWYSGAAGRQISRPCWLLVTHFFNHQTHHRGQVHCMLTRLGARPEATDLMLIE